MRKQYYQSQYILNKVFNNKDNILRATLNSSQDYLNAIYDPSKDAIRVNFAEGSGIGGFSIVDGIGNLPETATEGQLCPVYNHEKNNIDFYEWSGDDWVYRGSSMSGSSMDEDERMALAWITSNIDKIKEVTNFNYIVNVEDVTLSPDTTVVEVQGEMQDIDDDLNGDNDSTTPYRIDLSGYVLSVSTYVDSSSEQPESYFTRITYESDSGSLGTSHIYLQQEEYNYFSRLEDGKNILRVYYLTNAMNSPVKRMRLIIGADGQAIDADGNEVQITVDDAGDHCIPIFGYVLGIETYASQEALIPDKCYVKMIYETNGVYSGKTKIFVDDEEFSSCSALTDGKNIIDVYYLNTVFPAAVTMNEMQLQFPSNEVSFVALDASGNTRNIADTMNKDGDESTNIKITVNGYAVDVDGYYDENDSSKKRFMAKMSYNPSTDTTDIYFDNEWYDQISSFKDGKNIISIYTIVAGIGVNTSKFSRSSSSKSNKIIRSEENDLTVSAGENYVWTVGDNVGATLTFNGDSDSMSQTYIDLSLGSGSTVFGSNISFRQTPEAGRMNRCRIDHNGSMTLLYVYDVI